MVTLNIYTVVKILLPIVIAIFQIPLLTYYKLQLSNTNLEINWHNETCVHCIYSRVESPRIGNVVS